LQSSKGNPKQLRSWFYWGMIFLSILHSFTILVFPSGIWWFLEPASGRLRFEMAVRVGAVIRLHSWLDTPTFKSAILLIKCEWCSTHGMTTPQSPILTTFPQGRGVDNAASFTDFSIVPSRREGKSFVALRNVSERSESGRRGGRRHTDSLALCGHQRIPGILSFAQVLNLSSLGSSWIILMIKD